MKLAEFVFSDWMWRLPEGRGRIAVTFDDGPHESTTLKLLDALDKNRIPSTHFLNGQSCEGKSSLLKEIVSRGHAVANHGFTHQHFWLRGYDFQFESVKRTHETFLSAGIEPARFFRPPYGAFNWNTTSVLRNLNYTGVMWSAIAEDWKSQSADELWSRIASKLHDGAILVLHDGHAMTDTVIEILPRLAETITERGWQFASASELLPHTTPLAECS